MRDQIRDVSRAEPGRYLPFVGTLFLFIATSNLLAIVPGFEPPTGSLSTTTALAICVLVAVPLFGIAEARRRRLSAQTTSSRRRLHAAVQHHRRAVAHAGAGRPPVRQHDERHGDRGDPVGIVPFFFPVVMQLLGLLTGLIQAYIFAVLAMVYIASATRTHPARRGRTTNRSESAVNGDPAWTVSD